MRTARTNCFRKRAELYRSYRQVVVSCNCPISSMQSFLRSQTRQARRRIVKRFERNERRKNSGACPSCVTRLMRHHISEGVAHATHSTDVQCIVCQYRRGEYRSHAHVDMNAINVLSYTGKRQCIIRIFRREDLFRASGHLGLFPMGLIARFFSIFFAKSSEFPRKKNVQ